LVIGGIICAIQKSNTRTIPSLEIDGKS
jgi:hypothetical protein